jgi:hypothetical protein
MLYNKITANGLRLPVVWELSALSLSYRKTKPKITKLCQKAMTPKLLVKRCYKL